MRSLIVSTIVFFVASFFIKRRFVEMGLPKGMTRSLMVFCRMGFMVKYTGIMYLMDSQ